MTCASVLYSGIVLAAKEQSGLVVLLTRTGLQETVILYNRRVTCMTFLLALVRIYTLKLRQSRKRVCRRSASAWCGIITRVISSPKASFQRTIPTFIGSDPHIANYFVHCKNQMFKSLLHNQNFKRPKDLCFKYTQVFKSYILDLFLKNVKMPALNISRNRQVFRCSVRLKDNDLKYSPQNCLYSIGCNTSNTNCNTKTFISVFRVNTYAL